MLFNWSFYYFVSWRDAICCVLMETEKMKKESGKLIKLQFLFGKDYKKKG